MKIFLIGFMGCGKTHWGHRIARKLELPFFDLDHQIEHAEDKTINAIFHENGEDYFRQREKEVLIEITEQKDAFVMATGGGTPCFHNNLFYMKESGKAVWLNCGLDSIYTRLSRERTKRPLVKDQSEEELRSFIQAKLDERTPFYRQANVIITGDSLELETLVSKILHF